MTTLALVPADTRERRAKDALRQLHRNVSPKTQAQHDAMRRAYTTLVRLAQLQEAAIRAGATDEDAVALRDFFDHERMIAKPGAAPCPVQTFHAEERAEGRADEIHTAVMVMLVMGRATVADLERARAAIIQHRDAYNECITALTKEIHKRERERNDWQRPMSCRLNGDAPRAS